MSCANRKNLYKNIEGDFIGLSEAPRDEIRLNNNGTFYLVFRSIITKRCKGTWSFVSNNMIVLKCAESSDFLESIRSDYMGGDSINIKIINNNKLKVNKIIFKRIEQSPASDAEKH